MWEPLIRLGSYSGSAGLIGLLSSPLRLKTVEPSGRILALIGISAVMAAFAGFVAQRLSVGGDPLSIQFTIGEPEHLRFGDSSGMLALSPNGECFGCAWQRGNRIRSREFQDLRQ